MLQKAVGGWVPHRVVTSQVKGAACFILLMGGSMRWEVGRYPRIDRGITSWSSSCVNTIACEVSVGVGCKNFGQFLTTMSLARICIGHSRLFSIVGICTAWCTRRMIVSPQAVSTYARAAETIAVPGIDPSFGSYLVTFTVLSYMCVMRQCLPTMHVSA